jgi:putative ABC transport system substrate-binding protein
VKRRQFIRVLGASAAWPLAINAQQSSTVVLGILQAGLPGPNPGVAALLKGLEEAGYYEGHNLAIEYRYAEGELSRLGSLAADLAGRHVAVIAALGGTAPALAAKAATAAIPIVFAAPQNPVELGLVDNLDRPGGNVTGVVGESDELTARRVDLLHDLLPNATTLTVLVNPAAPINVDSTIRAAQAGAHSRGVRVHIARASSERELDETFVQLAALRVDALLVGADVSFFNWRNQIVALALRHRIPASYWRRDFVALGGLTSCGANFEDLYRRAGLYIARILKGERPADLPVLRPARLEVAFNAKTAKALGLNIPPGALAIVDEVIE